MLPGDMTGIELANYALTLDRRIKLIFISGYSAAEVLDQGDQAVRNAPFLMKPLEMEDFFRIVGEQFAEQGAIDK